MNCRQVSRLVSDGLDRKLALHERLAVWIHLLYCRACAAYRRQVRMLREFARPPEAVTSSGVVSHESAEPASSHMAPDFDEPLSPEARHRIRQALDAPPSE
ncbi:MAG: hypothetical protein BroJett003_13930 [Planctomycetota bacterium]|nr:MAG: hypothetical protein BroJett003_13930 [Planctomycetota bacterium]